MSLKLTYWFLLLAVAACAQSRHALDTLNSGQVVRIETSQSTLVGTLIEAAPDALRIRPDVGAEAAIAKADIRRVWIQKKSNRIRNTLIGAAVGVAAGAVLYSTLGAIFRNEGAESAQFLLLPIVAGTVTGGVLPSGGMKLAYDVSRRQESRQ
jgi:hypothetical protein